jgi:hypothetical protein
MFCLACDKGIVSRLPLRKAFIANPEGFATVCAPVALRTRVRDTSNVLVVGRWRCSLDFVPEQKMSVGGGYGYLFGRLSVCGVSISTSAAPENNSSERFPAIRLRSPSMGS